MFANLFLLLLGILISLATPHTHLCALASTSAHVAEFAAPAEPVFLVLLEGALLR